MGPRQVSSPTPHGLAKCATVLPALIFFEAAARLESFTAAGAELGVTAAAVAYRIRRLESYLGVNLFARYPHSVRLNAEGRAYVAIVQRILAELQQANEDLRGHSQRPLLKLITVEMFAEKWLMPRLSDFRATCPDLTMQLATEQGVFDPDKRDFDVWITFADKIEHAPQWETLFHETLVAVCSPSLLKVRGQPREPNDLHRWPLLYNMVWASDWSYWFAHHGAAPADLSRANGFQLYSVMVQAAVTGMGVALGHSTMIADELQRGTLVPLFDAPIAAPARYLLCSGPQSLDKPEVQAFLDWIRRQAIL